MEVTIKTRLDVYCVWEFLKFMVVKYKYERRII